MARVLVIEDEETLRTNVVRGLSKLPGVEVFGAGTLGEALAVIDRAPPDVVLSDLDLPDRPGVELIGELGRRGLRCPVTFVSAYTRAFSAQIPRHANVQVVDKPAPLERLREIVRHHLGSHAPAGNAAPFGVADYLQIACMGQHSVCIEVRAGEADGTARIVVHRGVLWSAQDTHGTGEDAFMRLADARGPGVNVRAMQEPAGEPNIHRGWEALLLDAARAEDERAREAPLADGPVTGQFFALEARGPRASSAPPRAPERRPSAPAPAPSFEDACEQGVAALLGRDHHAAFRAFRTAERLRPDDRTVQANLKRLRDLGIAEPAEESTEGRLEGGSS